MGTPNARVKGILFNIQQFSVHDGPGIRTIAFFKGCPLRCIWCSNPESQSATPELAYNPERCLTFDHCVRCLEICTPGAIHKNDDNRPRIDRRLCTQCLLCTDACPAKALWGYGETTSVAQVLEAVERDGVFYARSGGGLTLSGGEPMHQPAFAIALLEEARRHRINTAMETCGHCRTADLVSAAAHLNTLIYDLKIMDDSLHRQYTGVSNALILSNLKQVRQACPQLPVLVRTPVIPGINDNAEAIAAIVDFIAGMPRVRYEMLAYHRMGTPKYGYLGRTYEIAETALADGRMTQLKQMVHHRHPDLPLVQ
ncbi:MAG: glycyl-radical enzyme activating protein [Desulfobacterales bacterium]|jgi:pyruvate formate lyase activating enzyme|nr:glycyl-radical enzyme activating protein [Desulfobacterales bacterium]